MDGDARAGRLATPALVGHIALIAFSTVALTTFLASSTPPAWLQAEPNATVYRLGWRFSGPSYVVLGAVAALLHAWGKLGARRAWTLFFTGSLVSLASELVGTSTGLPFGPYTYTSLLGYRIAGLVPFPIPISWFYMIYGSLAICGRLLPARDEHRAKLGWALVAGAVLTAWDVSMDPAMVRTSHWVWAVKGPYYGMPWSNWLGWYLTGTLIARLMLAAVPPSIFVRRVSPSTLPFILYAANGILPVALCARDAMPGAALLGTLAMFTPLFLAFSRNPHSARSLPLPPAPA